MTILCHVPVSLSAITYRPCLPLWNPQLNQALCPLSRLLPLFPNVTSVSTAQPSIPFLHCCLYARYPEVTKPTPYIDVYLLHDGLYLSKRFRVAIGLCFVMQTHPRLRPYMRFLFVRPEICPLGNLSTPKIRLSSDSVSRRTPLPLANPSHCRADSGLSPYRACAHRAH